MGGGFESIIRGARGGDLIHGPYPNSDIRSARSKQGVATTWSYRVESNPTRLAAESTTDLPYITPP